MNRFGDIDCSFKKLPPVYGFRVEKIVSLEEALKPIESTIDQLTYFIKIAKKSCHFPNDHGLSKDQSASIYIYTMEWGETTLYRVLNEALRSENRQALKIWFPYLKLFDTALDLLPTVKESVWRGVPLDIGKNFTKNQMFTWWAISSCSSSVNVIETFLQSKNNSTLFLIEVVNGKKVSGYTEYEGEDEVILRVGTEFRVKADPLKRADGSHIVHLIEIRDDEEDDDDDQPIAPPKKILPVTPKSKPKPSNFLDNVENILQINKNDLEIKGKLGEGILGQVYKGKWLKIDLFVAIKTLHLTHFNDDIKRKLINELLILKSVSHPNIVKFYGVCVDEDQYSLITEYVSLHSLFDLLEEKRKFSLPEQLSIGIQIATGINYLHQSKPQILHRNIKSTNILLENHHSGYNVKICDFNMIQIRNQSKGNISICWTAPEVLDLDPYTEKSDIYSLGVVYWELVTYQIPYDGHSNSSIRDFILSGRRLKIPQNISTNFRLIIEKCWSQNPNDRPTCSDLLNMFKEQHDQKQKQSNSFFFMK